MAEPARRLDPIDPKDPVNVMPSRDGTVPPELDPRFQSANQDSRVDNRPVVESRGAGSGVIIAGIVVVLAIVAYFMFAPGAEAPAPVEPATTSEPAAPAVPAPDATAPRNPGHSASFRAECDGTPPNLRRHLPRQLPKRLLRQPPAQPAPAAPQN
jgi:hypothetical protein